MKEVNAGIITIGDELLIGQTIDTNSAFVAQELNKIGIWIKKRVSIGDVREDILQTLKQLTRECDVVIVTGGLGPTADDITKPTLCEFFNTALVINKEALQNVHDIFSKMGREVTERNRKQAELPAACIPLINKRGTASGMWFDYQNDESKAIVISLPGVPYEMKGLITDAVVPRLQRIFDFSGVMHKTLLTSGRGESEVADMLIPFEGQLPSEVKLAYLPDHGLLRLRLTARGMNNNLDKILNEQFEQLKTYVSAILVTDEDLPIYQYVQQLLRKKNKTLAVAESCTGGYIAHLITSVAGSSDVFKGSIVSYANDIKTGVLQVEAATIDEYGAVSEQTVGQMVRGAMKTMNSDYAIATSGIMGPGGGTPAKPVGTLWLAAGSRGQVITSKMHLRYDRAKNIQVAATAALNLLRKLILSEEA